MTYHPREFLLSGLMLSVVFLLVLPSAANSSAAGQAKRSHSPRLAAAIDAQGVIHASQYSDFATALSAAAGKTLIINKPMSVSTPAVVLPSTKLKFEAAGLLHKTGSGTITFQGIGLADSKSQHPAFAAFEIGDLRWSGTDYPREVSLELWDTSNTSLSDRLELAAGTFKGRVVKLFAYPRVITKSVELFDGQSIHFTRGDYTNVVTGYPLTPPPFLLNNHCGMTADPGAVLYESNSPKNAHLVAAKMMYVTGSDGTVEDIQIRDLYIKGHPSQIHNGASSTIILGNARNSSVRNVVLDGVHAYGITVGGFSTAGNYADGVEVTNIRILNTGTQLVNVINGKNILFRDIQIDLRNHNSSSAFVAIDIEPNTTDNKVENITVENITVDARTKIPDVYMSAVAMQAAGAAQLINPVVRNVRVLGRDLSTDQSPGFFHTGVEVYGAVGGIIEDVSVQGLMGRVVLVQASRNLKLRNINAIQCTSASLIAVEMQACAGCEVEGISLRKSSSPLRQYTNIKELELEYTVTASGSTVTETNPGGYPRFYDHFAGLKVLLNNTLYTVKTVNNMAFSITTANPVGTLAVKTFASTDVDILADRLAIVNHGHKTGSKVKYAAGTGVVGGLTAGSSYFVIAANANTLKLATTLENALAGRAIDLTSTGSGTQTLTPVLVTRFSSNRYRNNKADDGIFLEPTGTSTVDATVR